MVEYYGDIWARQGEMLASLTDLVNECRHAKIIRANKTKNGSGIGMLFIKMYLTT
jgi:hypothetical protein